MASALCLFASPAELRGLAPTLRGLSAAGAVLRAAAPRIALDQARSLGIPVERVLPDAPPPGTLRSALAELVARDSPSLLLVAAGSGFTRAARELAASIGVPLALLQGGPPAPPLALEDFVGAAKGEIEEIAPEAARRILQAPDREGWHFVDVREPDEYAAGHLPGARSSPRGFLEVRADLEHYKRDPWFEDRERPLILYCGGGHRSALATQTLQRMGFTRVLSLAEGFTGWTERSYPVTDPEQEG